MEVVYSIIDLLANHISKVSDTVAEMEKRVILAEEAYNRLHPTAVSRVWGLFRRAPAEAQVAGMPEWNPVPLTFTRNLRAAKADTLVAFQDGSLIPTEKQDQEPEQGSSTATTTKL